MKKNLFKIIFATVSIVAIFVACKEDAPVVTAKNWSFVEEFDTLGSALAKGWIVTNNSKPIGTSSWRQASPYSGVDSTITGGSGFGAKIKITLDTLAGFNNTNFTAQSLSGGGSDFVVAYFNCGADSSDLSAWLISPAVQVKNGDKIVFYLRSGAKSPALKADRLQVRLSKNESAFCGRGQFEVGDFTTMLQDINATYSLTGMPTNWTKYTINVTGVAAPSMRRFAFRYFVELGGRNGLRSMGLGIDSVAFVSTK